MNWKTHEVTNVVADLKNYNLYSSDIALQEAVRRAGATVHEAELTRYGALLGDEASLRMAEDAHHFKPELHTFDRQGNRIDRVEFHPAWHGFMSMAREQNLVAQPFNDPRPGAWAAYAAGFSMHGQIEPGSQCPNSMTFACIPVLQKEPELFEQLAPKLYSHTYDARDIPFEQKSSMLVGMGMTEKQGGSDVRANSTRATPLRGEGRGAEYEITGHKWFFSAPMCDAHLVLARTENGLSCFFVPRWHPDGSKNAIHIQRLKEKVGNRSNSSSEVEFLGAWGRMVGEEGRGIPTIIEMASYTRLNCVMGSAGTIRQALVQAIHYARGREAFGKRLADQPLMRNVLADMALESEAATQLMMRLTEAFALAEDTESAPLQRAWKRIVTPAAKYWVAKRSIELAGEAMEVFGGNGYMDESPMGRLYREAPVISIWEGSGNVMALDMLRAVAREPDALGALIGDLATVCRDDARLRPHLEAIPRALRQDGETLEFTARREAQRLILLIQARLLREFAPAEVADAFIASRFDDQWGRVFGTLPAGVKAEAIIERAFPV
ncbi:acyl-CoA dehydrogenase family protein [Paraburkholderia sp. B3]|uniref:acyl-CoA dehydrogenase family protein n=1 Tax=Paraburkholderia sp. B3 TaxID=3134791 RepID=UPI003982198C